MRDASARNDACRHGRACRCRARAPAPARAQGALHHQQRGAELHRQCAAGGGLRAVDDASADEIGGFVAGADSLLVNLGTFDAERRAAVEAALEAAAGKAAPWVLDPVFIDRSAARAQFARSLLMRAPAAVRLNQAEFAALAGGKPPHEPAAFARGNGTVVAISGATDLVTDGARQATIANGHALMARVTAMGCAGSALVAACLAVEQDAFAAAAAALVILGVAGEIAAEQAQGPGSFAVGIVDALYNLDGATIAARAKVN